MRKLRIETFLRRVALLELYQDAMKSARERLSRHPAGSSPLRIRFVRNYVRA